jgi:hypothetical protein
MKTALLAALLLALPASAQLATYQDEVLASGAYEGAATDEPLVVVSGAAAPGFVFRGDEIERSLGVSAVHLLRPAVDDGATPLALLPFVARVSSLAADVSLAARSDDSSGASTGQQVSVTSRLTGDRSTRTAGLSGEWFVERATSVRGGVSGAWRRETDSTSQLESPSGHSDLANVASRTSAGTVTFGAARRFGRGATGPALLRGLEAELAIDGSYGWRTFRRDDEILFSEAGGSRRFSYELGSRARSLALSARALLLERRLLLEAEASYLTTGGALTQDGQKIDRSFAIVRSLSASATWFPCRRLGVTAGASYATETDTGGLVSELPTGFDKEVSWRVAARLFATERASFAAGFARTSGVQLVPPDAPTFQRLETTTNRVDATASVRF